MRGKGCTNVVTNVLSFNLGACPLAQGLCIRRCFGWRQCARVTLGFVRPCTTRALLLVTLQVCRVQL